MKKNLISAIIILFVAVFSLGVTSFAFFSSNSKGDNNNVGVGTFDFDYSDTIAQDTKIKFKAPTIINFPALASTSQDFNKCGDDANFNDYCVPITLTIANKSPTLLGYAVNIAATNASGADYSSALMWSVFTVADTTPLIAESGAEKGQYKEKLHTRCDTFPVTTETTIQAKNETRRNANNVAVNAVSKSSAGGIAAASGGTATNCKVLVVLWLDYLKMKEAIPNSPTSSLGSLTITITVTGTNEIV